MQQGKANDSCEEKIVCAQATESESSNSGKESSPRSRYSPPTAESGSGSYNYDYYDEDYDEDNSNSSHSQSEHPTLGTKSDIQDVDEEDDNESTDDSRGISVTASQTCISDRQFFLSFNYSWIPHCDCQGFYEPVQCWMKGDQMECWCSTRNGSMVGNRRTILSCTDPEQL